MQTAHNRDNVKIQLLWPLVCYQFHPLKGAASCSQT